MFQILTPNALLIFNMILLVSLTIFVVRYITNHHKNPPSLLGAVVAAIPYIVFAFEEAEYPTSSVYYWSYQLLSELSALASLVFLGIFFSHLKSPNAQNWWIFLCIMGMSPNLVLIFVIIIYPNYTNVMLVLDPISGSFYWAGILSIVAGIGFPVYFHMYRYTREKLALFLVICNIITIVGAVIGIIYWIGENSFVVTPVWWLDLNPIYKVFWDVGIAIGLAMLVVKTDYIYRLPFDVYALFVSHRDNGLLLFRIYFETKIIFPIEPWLISGFFNAINEVSHNFGLKNDSLEKVAGPNLNFLLELGEDTMSVFITNKDTFFLRLRLKQFTKDFEHKFATELKIDAHQVCLTLDAGDLVKINFPFLKISYRKEYPDQVPRHDK